MGCSSSVGLDDDCDSIRRDISKSLQLMGKLKKDGYSLQLSLVGLKLAVAEYQSSIAPLIGIVDAGRNLRQKLLEHVYERDCDDIRRACVGLGVDKAVVADIINNRTNDQLKCIGNCYQKKFNMSLLYQIRSEFTSATGGIITGALSDLGEFLEDRIEYQGDRDARLVNKYCEFLNSNHHSLIELLSTRTNAEMAALKSSYYGIYQMSLESLLKSKIDFPNYRDLAIKVSNGVRDERYVPLPADVVEAHCRTIYSKLDVFFEVEGAEINDIMCTMNPVIYAQLNAAYASVNRVNFDLTKHIMKDAGGSYEYLLQCLSRDRSEVWADSLHETLNEIMPDKDRLAR